MTSDSGDGEDDDGEDDVGCDSRPGPSGTVADCGTISTSVVSIASSVAGFWAPPGVDSVGAAFRGVAVAVAAAAAAAAGWSTPVMSDVDVAASFGGRGNSAKTFYRSSITRGEIWLGRMRERQSG